MANNPKLELQASDSQLSGFLDLASLPSGVNLYPQPPDIRNWFSSYVYESNSLDGFQDFDVSAKIFTEEEEKAKWDDIRVIKKINDGLHAGKMEFLDRIVKCSEADALEHSKHADVVLGFSDSLSLSSVSEPHDIRKWFSSYLDESPPLDTADGFIFSDYEERKESNAGIADLDSHTRISEVVAKCNNFVKGSKQTFQSDSTDCQKLEPNRIPHELNELASETISQHMLPEPKKQARSHDSVEEYINVNTYDKKNKAKSDTMLMCRTTQSNVVGSVENYAGGQEGNYCPSVKKKDNAKKGLSKEGKLQKENLGDAFPENGFVSTRKSSNRAYTMTFTEPQRVQFESRSQGVKQGPDHVECTEIRRNVLSETTNFHLTKELGITGKWCCPQRISRTLARL
ncbi:hypothetical protein F511_42262 [Dorcoceras hygrometricum]|uniref:Uncharacterized protein n=1 Tax=Dorcoceras hygrometricum TaxID=472368 RepID=A0A2Z6ZZD1_9LAMI|nr:hypothetical protein F511_42262 [Dorcoceras hygrometricum]